MLIEFKLGLVNQVGLNPQNQEWRRQISTTDSYKYLKANQSERIEVIERVIHMQSHGASTRYGVNSGNSSTPKNKNN